jgi:hypothetical protein
MLENSQLCALLVGIAATVKMKSRIYWLLARYLGQHLSLGKPYKSD